MESQCDVGLCLNEQQSASKTSETLRILREPLRGGCASVSHELLKGAMEKVASGDDHLVEAPPVAPSDKELQVPVSLTLQWLESNTKSWPTHEKGTWHHSEG